MQDVAQLPLAAVQALGGRPLGDRGGGELRRERQVLELLLVGPRVAGLDGDVPEQATLRAGDRHGAASRRAGLGPGRVGARAGRVLVEQLDAAAAAREQRLVVARELVEQRGQRFAAGEVLEQAQPAAVAPRGAVQPGHVGHHRDPAGAALVHDVVRARDDDDGAAVLALLMPFAGVDQAADRARQRDQALALPGRVQVGQPQRGDVAGLVAVELQEGLVDLDQRQRVALVDQHRRRVVREERAVFLLDAAQRGDVAPDPQHAQHRAVRPAQRGLDRLQQLLVAVAGEGDDLLVDARAVALHRRQVMLAEEVGQLGRDEVAVAAPENARLGLAVELLEAAVAGQVEAVRVLQPDQVGNRLEHRALQRQPVGGEVLAVHHGRGRSG